MDYINCMIPALDNIKLLFINCPINDMNSALGEMKQYIKHVESHLIRVGSDVVKELKMYAPDVVVAECSPDNNDNLQLFQSINKNAPNIPYILLTNSSNEALAAECLKAGAANYVLKNHLIFFPFTIFNALDNQIERQKKVEAEKKLHESELIYDQVVEISRNAVFIIRNHKFISINTSFAQLFEYSPKEVTDANFNFTDLVSPEQKAEVQQHLNDLTESGNGRKQFIFNAISKTGKRFEADARISYDSTKGYLIMQGIISDISYKLALEKELKRSDSKFKNIFQDHSAAKLIIEPDSGQILDANFASARFYGWDVEELKKMNISQITHYPTTEVKIDVPKPSETSEFYSELKHLTAKGETVDVEVFSSRVDYEGKIALHYIVHDITARKRAEQKLHLLNHAVEQNPVAIVITNSKGTIEYVNPEFTIMTGYTYEEAVGDSPRILKSGYQDKPFYEDLWNTIISGETWSGEFKNRKKNGELYWQESTISPIIDENGEISHFVAVLEDITNKKKMIEDLVYAKEKAEESDRLKSAFLANMSHEIRTPMNGIIGFTDLLKEQKLSGKEKAKYINIIRKSGERMLNTLNDLIEISQIESGTTELDYDIININDQMDAFYHQFANEARNKGIEFTCTNGLSDEQAMIETDHRKLNSILINLLKNALKYTYFGSIHFGYQKKNNHLEFYITDTGIGIEANRHKIIFDRFVQADMSLTKPYEGAGLGLSIAKAYVTMLGGEIWLESKPGEGTKFFFTLPLREIPHIESYNDDLETNDGEIEFIKNLTILVVEDDAIGKLYIQELLEGNCKRLIFASDGYEALQHFKQESDSINVVLMDIKMPGMNGYETAGRIKLINEDVYIIAQTAYAMSGDREKALASGCDNYLTKPFSKMQLINTILQMPKKLQ